MPQPPQPPSGFDPTPAPALTALSLTHILYDPTSPLSLASAHLSLLPQILLICLGTVIFTTREIEPLLFLLGQLLNEGLNMILKRCLKQHRPPFLSVAGKHHNYERRGYGMPSSHAQFVGFFAIYLSLLLLLRLPTSTHRGLTYQRFKKSLYISLGWIAAAGVGLARVELKYHTLEQVLVGWGVGIVVGVVWFGVGSVARRWTTFWEWGMGVWGFFWGRDEMMAGDLVEGGYRRWREGVERKEQ